MKMKIYWSVRDLPVFIEIFDRQWHSQVLIKVDAWINNLFFCFFFYLWMLMHLEKFQYSKSNYKFIIVLVQLLSFYILFGTFTQYDNLHGLVWELKLNKICIIIFSNYVLLPSNSTFFSKSRCLYIVKLSTQWRQTSKFFFSTL